MSKTLNNKDLKVLVYHKIHDRKGFEQQLIFLQEHYRILSLQEFEQFLFENKSLPKRSVLITFDDGDWSLYDNAFPILNKYRISAVIFIISGLIGTTTPFWWDELAYYLGKVEGHRKTWEVKNWPNAEREAYLIELRKLSGKPELQDRQLTLAELKEMQKAGITIANHSHTHPMFDRCKTEELRQEIQHSTTTLKKLNFVPDVFAYPNGNFSEKSEKLLKEQGIRLAFLFDHKINKKEIDPLRISRLIVNDSTPLWKFKLILSGWHSHILPLTRTMGKFYRRFNLT